VDVRELTFQFLFLFITLFVSSLSLLVQAQAQSQSEAQAQAQSQAPDRPQILPTTEIVGEPIDDIGSRSATRPVEVLRKNQVQGDLRYHLSDALNSAAGVQSRLEGSPLLSIRGSQSSARVLALQDGVPLNFSDGVGFNPLFVANENMESIGLLKGPASSLFGRDALAGAVEFKSERLKSEKFYISQGSFNTSRVFAGTPIATENFFAQVTAYQTHSDGNFIYTIPRQGGTAARVRNDHETLRSTILAQSVGTKFKWKTFHLIAREIGSTPDAIYAGYPSSFNNWGELSSLHLDTDISEHFEVASRSSFKTLTQYSSPNFNSLTTSFRQGVSAIFKSGDFSLEAFDDGSWETFQASYFLTTQPLNINEYGLKSQYVTENKIVIQPAARFSSENNSFSPSLGFSGLDENEWKYFLNYSEGYSPVTVTQKYSVSPGFVANPNLQAEHSSEIDLGFEKQVREFFIHFETFGREINNLIQNIPSGNLALTPQNMGKARAYGFEFQGKANAFINSGINLNYLQNKKVDSDAPILLSPTIQASVFLEKVFGEYSLVIQDTQWSSYYDVNFATGQNVQLNGWNTVDLFLKIALYSNWHGEIALLNILDQPRELGFGYPEPQSSFSFNLVGYL
jgi:outer membrane receptor protein involved in Fe transport